MTNFVAKGTEFIQKAVNADNSEDFASAVTFYTSGIEYLLTALKYEKNQKIIEAIQSKAIKYLTRAEEIKDLLQQQQSKQSKSKNKNKNKSSSSSNHRRKNSNSLENKENDLDDLDDEDTSKLKNGLASAIVMTKPNVQWSDVAGLDKAKSLLKETVILPTRFPQLFTKKRKPFQGILLYGPLGTGKSFLAKAVANEANKSTFFSVSSSDLISKFVGESEKLIKYLYTLAKSKKPSIIFIDEIDSLATSRNDSDSSSTRRVKTELLVQMQGVGNDCTGILTLGATNCPWDLDPAVRRRFAKRIYIPLPDTLARKEMFKLHVGDDGNDKDIKLNDNDYGILADKTDGYSGSDIDNICQDALMEPIRTLQTATHFKKVVSDNDYIWIPCSPSDPNGVKMNLLDFDDNEQDKIKCEPLKLSHFIRVLQTSNKSVSKGDLTRYIEWTEQFGQEG